MPILTIRKKLENSVISIIEGPASHPLFSLATLLLILSRIYGAVMHFRRVLYQYGIFTRHRLPCFVISVGNLCMGGTGKTPMALYLGNQLAHMGYTPVVLSRGYKGIYENRGTVVSDGRNVLCDARHAGDEPYLLANLLQGVPVVVGRDRVAAGKTALEQFKADVLILDDGFQHLRLQRDLNLLLLDARKPFGNFSLLPRGPLRESVSTLSHADAVIMTRCDAAGSSHGLECVKQLFHEPIFYTSHKPIVRGVLPAGQCAGETHLTQLNPGEAGLLKDRRVLAFSGLGHNDAFWESLSRCGARLDRTIAYNDHHPYDLADVKDIERAVPLAGSDYLVTTDKDYVRLPQKARFSLDLMVMGISIDFQGQDARWQQLLVERLRRDTV